MPPTHTPQDHQTVIEHLRPNAAARTRISTQRADRLREFILGHLPDEVTVDVIISSAVETAAVLPADIDAILSSDATEVERTQAEQLLGGVDADYLVLVTGNEADLTRIPINDQLTADHAHQFGLAFHELLHILKTAITAIAELLDAEVDEQYHTQVHDLINIIEDGAIEAEAIHGENFSDNAGIRLELTRRLHSLTPEDISAGGEVRYSFWDAVTSCLYDEAIYPTGTTDVLLDEDDPRIRFKSQADRAAFETVHAELCNLAADTLAIRSADRSDTTHSHDKTASIRRAQRVIDTWQTHIEPILESEQALHQEQSQSPQQEQTEQQGSSDADAADSSPSAGRPGDASSALGSAAVVDEGSDAQSDNERSQNAAQDATMEAGVDGDTEPSDRSLSGLPDGVDPGDLSLSREATSDPHQNIFEQPQLTADPALAEVGDSVKSCAESHHADEQPVCDVGKTQEHDEYEKDAATAAADTTEDGTGTGQSGGDTQPDNGEAHPGSEPSSRAQGIARVADRIRRREQEQGQQNTGVPESQVPPSPGLASGTAMDGDSQTGGSNVAPTAQRDRLPQERGQLSLGNFGGETQDEPQSGKRTDAEEMRRDATAQSSKVSDRSDRTMQTDPGDETPQPAHAGSTERSPENDEETYKDALVSDERAAHGESDREGIDERALEDELTALADHLERSARQETRTDQGGSPANSGQSGGSRGGSGSLDDLTILPLTDDFVPPCEWASVEEGADQVASTLEMYLRLERRKSERRGLSAGAYDTRAGHRLAIGDSRVCKSRTVGNEKQYALVLVLDRSGSMRRGSPSKIEVATQALARFALAAETLGIRVAIVDFIHGEARLVKPFSVDTRHVQAALLDTSCGGGTPLADAIGLACDLVEAQRDEPLIITVTDDEPASTNAVIEQIKRSYAPVCSLTIATDCEPGTLSGTASELARYYERQEAVYSADRLDDRLDQFASLLAGF